MTSDEKLFRILEKLEECRAERQASRNKGSVHLVSVAILDVRMRLHRIGDAELRALCDEMLADESSARLRDAKSSPTRRPMLRVVK